jgi:tetratricopeptide (TPR) repeat protein
MMQRALIALLLCGVAGCAIRPNFISAPLTCELVPRTFLTPSISVLTFSSLTGGATSASPERLRVRDDMIAMVRAGKLKSALAMGETQLALQEAELKAGRGNAVELAGLVTEISELQHALKRMALAEAGYLRAIALYSDVRFEYPEMLRPTLDLAILYRGQGKPALALPLQLAAYPKLLAWLGPDHPDVIESEAELAHLHLALKQYDEALPLFQARLERARLAGDKAATVQSRKALAKIRRARPLKRA